MSVRRNAWAGCLDHVLLQPCGPYPGWQRAMSLRHLELFHPSSAHPDQVGDIVHGASAAARHRLRLAAPHIRAAQPRREAPMSDPGDLLLSVRGEARQLVAPDSGHGGGHDRGAAGIEGGGAAGGRRGPGQPHRRSRGAGRRSARRRHRAAPVDVVGAVGDDPRGTRRGQPDRALRANRAGDRGGRSHDHRAGL